jgi:hypothetical protein
MENNIKKAIAGATVVAGSALTYWLLRKRLTRKENYHVKNNAQTLIRKVMHKSNESIA